VGLKTASLLADKRSVEIPSAAHIAGRVNYLTFRVARQDFIMESARVRALIPRHRLTLLDAPHGWLTGFATVSGRDLPVVDLRTKLGLAPGSLGRQPIIVVADAGQGRLVGFVADCVSELVTLREREIKKGIVRINGRARRLLDPWTILTEDDFVQMPFLHMFSPLATL
jgi:chemotaxis signal transduction protein